MATPQRRAYGTQPPNATGPQTPRGPQQGRPLSNFQGNRPIRATDLRQAAPGLAQRPPAPRPQQPLQPRPPTPAGAVGFGAPGGGTAVPGGGQPVPRLSGVDPMMPTPRLSDVDPMMGVGGRGPAIPPGVDPIGRGGRGPAIPPDVYAGGGRGPAIPGGTVPIDVVAGGGRGPAVPVISSPGGEAAGGVMSRQAGEWGENIWAPAERTPVRTSAPAARSAK